MSKYVGQISGVLNGPSNNLLLPILNKGNIIKLGIQLDRFNHKIFIRENLSTIDKEILIGKTNKIEYENVNITSLKIKPLENNLNAFYIIDYILEME